MDSRAAETRSLNDESRFSKCQSVGQINTPNNECTQILYLDLTLLYILQSVN